MKAIRLEKAKSPPWVALIAGVVVVMAGMGFAAEMPPTSAPARPMLRLGPVAVDRSAGTITVRAKVVKPTYMLEFLLCQAGTKEYESLLATQAKPHQLHAALLVLGLRPGKPGERIGTTYLPPRGAALAIEFRWKDKAGRTRTVPAGDWLKLSGKGAKGVKPSRWVFVGSDMLPGGGYAADQDGGIIAVANVADAVIDVPLASTASLRQREFVVNSQVVPPVGTPVEILIRPDKNARHADHARSLLEIGPRGELAMDGEPMDMEKLTAWAEAVSRNHKHARVVIRSDARTLAGVAPQARLELKLGGIYEFEYRTAPPRPPLLPRTRGQLEADVRQWRERFAQPEEQIDDPRVQADKTLKQIERRRAELQQLDALWAQYAKALGRQRAGQAKNVQENPPRTSPPKSRKKP